MSPGQTGRTPGGVPPKSFMFIGFFFFFPNIVEKSSFEYGKIFSIENGFAIPSPSLATEKQDPGLNISIENDKFFTPRMKLSSENEHCVRGGIFAVPCKP